MTQACTAVLYSPGTNCYEETAAAIELAGGKAELVLLKDLFDESSALMHSKPPSFPGDSPTGTIWGPAESLPPCSWLACAVSWFASLMRKNLYWAFATASRF